jgi:hypothetical protein
MYLQPLPESYVIEAVELLLVGLLAGFEIGVLFGEGRGNMGTLTHT